MDPSSLNWEEGCATRKRLRLSRNSGQRTCYRTPRSGLVPTEENWLWSPTRSPRAHWRQQSPRRRERQANFGLESHLARRSRSAGRARDSSSLDAKRRARTPSRATGIGVPEPRTGLLPIDLDSREPPTSPGPVREPLTALPTTAARRAMETVFGPTWRSAWERTLTSLPA